MKEKEILRIANGVIPPAWLDDRVRFLIHFAQLVAAAEREACAKVCEKYADVLEPLRPEGIATDYFQGGFKSASRRNAAAIRARGQQ